jgi:Tol biopolymer transport system component
VIFASLVFLALGLMLDRLSPPFSATLPLVVPPTLRSNTQQLTGTATRFSLTPSRSAAFGTQPFTLTPTFPPPTTVPFQTQPPPNTLPRSWNQGILVYLLKISSGFNSINMLNLENGTGPQLLLQPTSRQHFYGPSLSPDSSKLVFYDINGSDGILDLQDLSVLQIESCNSPTYSHDGTQIICGQNGHFRILDASNGALIRSLDAGVNGWLPVFSPDGAEVAFSVIGPGGKKTIMRMDAAGGKPVSLASAAFENYCPAWSPDGNWIAYQSDAADGHSDIWIMDRDGRQKRQVTSKQGEWSRGPAWSPDGKWLAYVSSPSGTPGVEYGDVFVISLDTGEIHQVTNTSGAVDNWRLSWGPVR